MMRRLLILLWIAGLCAPAAAQSTFDAAEFEVTPIVTGALFEPYAHAIASLAFWALLSIGLIPLSVIGKARARSDSGHPVRDYSDPAYRRHRALRNAVETSGPFIAATVACILAGAPAFWVNLLASVFIIARFSTAIVHSVSENEMARSATWAVGMLCLIGLTGFAVIAAMNL